LQTELNFPLIAELNMSWATVPGELDPPKTMTAPAAIAPITITAAATIPMISPRRFGLLSG
jgi:hypothetical protein